MEFAAVTGPNKPLDLKTGPVLQTPPNGLRIKTSYAGICHTDLNFLKDEINLGSGLKSFRSKTLAEQGKSYVVNCIFKKCAHFIL